MKKTSLLLLLFLLISCSLLYRPDINNIYDWVNLDIATGTKYIYKISDIYYDSSNTIIYSHNYIHIDKIDSFRLDSNYNEGGKYVLFDYYVGESCYTVKEGIYTETVYQDYEYQIFVEKDSEAGWIYMNFGNANNFTLLVTPIELNMWWFGNGYYGTRYIIREIGATRETAIGQLKDIIILEENYCDEYIGETWYSPSIGMMVGMYSDTLSKHVYKRELVDIK